MCIKIYFRRFNLTNLCTVLNFNQTVSIYKTFIIIFKKKNDKEDLMVLAIFRLYKSLWDEEPYIEKYSKKIWGSLLNKKVNG